MEGVILLLVDAPAAAAVVVGAPPKTEAAGVDNDVLFGVAITVDDDPNANGAPGVVRTGDIDGDGDIDVTASGDGDDGIYLFLNDGTGLFEMMTLDTGMVMAGDHYMTDLDGDGDQDIIWAVFGEIGLIGPESAVYAYLQDN